ncbi:MAG: peptide chain release factor N(5)-glutamine methyltransferase [Pseudohongiellaceae bacterium]|jgi:release factor glutamine methyltransferase|tara:strand:- start:7710 stop:8564 length:855 start_codon:yes stop_codon:yes gene_type:complete
MSMVITIKQALSQAQRLQGVSEGWRLESEILLAHVLNCERETLFAWPAQELSRQQADAYQNMMQRRERGEPIAYITGKKAFWDFELKVNPQVLIPRPETELLVETAINLLQPKCSAALRLADLGTGSGAIALALARHRKHWRITAVDISPQALALAAENAQLLQVENIEFCESSWCDGLDARAYDLVAANPPYVAVGDRHLQQGDLRFEPSIALAAEASGLSHLQEIVKKCRKILKKEAWLLLEHGFDQKQAVSNLLRDAGYSNISCAVDLAGVDRLTCAQSPG